jgi:hypothetical protein
MAHQPNTGRPTVSRTRVLLLLCVLVTPRAAAAHPVPFTYLDLTFLNIYEGHALTQAILNRVSPRYASWARGREPSRSFATSCPKAFITS